jgi:hypothetical protein
MSDEGDLLVQSDLQTVVGLGRITETVYEHHSFLA